MNKKEKYIDTVSGEKLTKITKINGDIYYSNSKNQFHRVDGPAVVRISGYLNWIVNGKFHRLDGPAIERPDGTKAWYIDGKRYTELEFIKINKEKNNENFS